MWGKKLGVSNCLLCLCRIIFYFSLCFLHGSTEHDQIFVTLQRLSIYFIADYKRYWLLNFQRSDFSKSVKHKTEILHIQDLRCLCARKSFMIGVHVILFSLELIFAFRFSRYIFWLYWGKIIIYNNCIQTLQHIWLLVVFISYSQNNYNCFILLSYKHD